MDMRTVGDKMHSYDSNHIYSIANLIETLLSSPTDKGAVGFIQARKLATLTL